MVLEEEINRLRAELESLVSQGKDMTSQEVIEVSGLLDQKIIQYMKLHTPSR